MPRTLAEALAVIRAMHHAVTSLRHLEVTEMVQDGREAEFDALVCRVLEHSAPVILAGKVECTVSSGVRPCSAARVIPAQCSQVIESTK